MRFRVSWWVALVCVCLLGAVPSFARPALAQDAVLMPLGFLRQGGAAYLSPDGARVAHSDGQRLCVYAITGGTPVCSTGDVRVPPDRSSVRWSPDSTRLAFTEDFPLRLVDADIWVMDAASGTLHNLTDDGVMGRISFSDSTLAGPLDVAPQWSPDGTRIIFVRYTRPDPQFVATLCAVPATGGPVVEGQRLPNTALDILVLALSADGARLAFGTGTRRDDPNAGAWVANADGTDARRVAADTIPAQVAFSLDARALLTFDASLLSQYATGWDQSTNRVYATDGSGNLPVTHDHAAHWAGWSPRGDALVYVVRRSTAEHYRTDSTYAGIYVVPRPGERGRQVVAGDFAGPITGTYGERGLTWATNDTTLVRNAWDGTFALVRLPPVP